jgi:hypothetical protein
MKQRIALVAVSALTAGVLSVIAAPVSNAAVITNCQIYDNAAAGAAGDAVNSNGLIATNCATNPNALLQTATMFATGAIAVTTANTADVAQRISVSGGTVGVFSQTGATGTDGTATVRIDKSRVDVAAPGAAGDTNKLNVLITPSAGVTSMVISIWDTYTSTATATDVVTVTIAAANLSGVATVADSTVAFVTADGDAATSDVAGTNAVTSRTALFLNVQANDVYGNDVTTGGLVVEVSSGALVGISASAGAAIGGLSSSSHSTSAITSAVSPADINIRVQEATAGKGWVGTIKVTLNGTLISTKSGTILGDISKITVTPKKIGKNDGNATTSAFDYQATDANGTTVVLAHGSLALANSSASGIISAAAGTATNSSSAAGKGSITCVSGATGKSTVTMSFILPSGTVISSNAAEFSCAGDASTYTASLDKASYVQGDIATLTVKFLDAKGNPANSMSAVTANTNDAVISANQMTLVSAYTAAQVTDVNGSVAFTLTAGTASGVIDGAYNAIVSFPTINAQKGSNQAVKYAVSSGSTAVSNAQVLQSIVALIASINKQIQALQKLILARR